MCDNDRKREDIMRSDVNTITKRQTGNYIEQKKKMVEQCDYIFERIETIKQAHDDYFTKKIIPDSSVIKPSILESWKRSIGYGIDPNNIKLVYVSDEELTKRMEKYSDLLLAAAPVLEEFADQFCSNLFTVDLYDVQACLIKMYGKESDLEKRPDYVRPGLVRTEEICGTTSISQALEEKAPTQLIGGEHFAYSLSENVCTAVPLFSQGVCIGLINVVEHQWQMDSRVLGTMVCLAKLVEYNYEQQKLSGELAKAVQVNEAIINNTPDGLMIISEDYTITRVNAATTKLLGVPANRLEGHKIGQIFGDENPIADVMRLGIPIKEQEIALRINGKVKRFIGNIKPIYISNKVSQVVISIKDMKSMRTLIKCVGGWTATYTFDSILGESPVFRQAVEFAEQTAMMDSNTLIVGASGTGKELFAHSIHNAGPFAKGPFISVNCAAIPMTLLESELFGYESGAYTGAKSGGQPGKFELAEGGTIFLDEINSIPLDMQVKLLRVLQDKKVTRIGGSSNIELHVKIIAATNEDLLELVQNGRFRADLYYRLNVITINIPPLMQHSSDIPLIASHIIERLSKSYDEKIEISEGACKRLMQYQWPGNVRELENVIERGFVQARLRHCPTLEESDLEDLLIETPKGNLLMQGIDNPSNLNAVTVEGDGDSSESTKDALIRTEKRIIQECLIKNRHNISACAKELGMARNTLYQRIKKYNL